MKHIGIAILLTALLTAQTAAEKTLSSAQHKEEAEGDLAGAVAGYRKAVTQAAKDRAIAARAQLRLGMALEKLGDANARAAFEQLLKNFGEQREEAAQARARIAALTAPRAAAGDMKKTILREPVFTGEPSPGGRYLPFEKGRDLYVYDHARGAARLVLKGPTGKTQGIGFTSISPDEKWVAYYKSDFARQPEIRVVGIDGTGDRLLRSDANFEDAWAASWSPYGKVILAISVEKVSDRKDLHFLDAASGNTLRKITGVPSLANVDWSPDGKWIALSGGDPRSPGPIQIARADSGGFSDLLGGTDRKLLVGWLTDGRILYTSDLSGTRDLYAVAVANGKTSGEPVLVRRDIGQAQSLRASRHGELFGVVSTTRQLLLEAEIDVEKAVILKGPVELPTRSQGLVRSADYSPDGKHLAFIAGTGLTDVGIFVRDAAGGESRRIPPPAVPSWVAWYPDGKSLVVLAAASAKERAFYRVDVATGAAQKLPEALIPFDAATSPAISPDGTFVYYKSRQSRSGPGATVPVIRRMDLRTGSETIVHDGARMFRLSPDGSQLLLSKGTAENDDYIAIVPVEGGVPRTVYAYPKSHLSRAFGGLWWTADSKGIFFHLVKGKSDELWFLRLDGSAPRKLLDTGIIYAGDSHPDNKRIALQTGQISYEIWRMESIAR